MLVLPVPPPYEVEVKDEVPSVVEHFLHSCEVVGFYCSDESLGVLPSLEGGRVEYFLHDDLRGRGSGRTLTQVGLNERRYLFV